MCLLLTAQTDRHVLTLLVATVDDVFNQYLRRRRADKLDILDDNSWSAGFANLIAQNLMEPELVVARFLRQDNAIKLRFSLIGSNPSLIAEGLTPFVIT